ncbi:hypothetical protein K438DRAFT_1753689 [Mycena galopus ATCC 62051]|nr:hypothetical protein K438DRAFT_1753689 [Mycena galopus ATCC 62051]
MEGTAMNSKELIGQKRACPFGGRPIARHWRMGLDPDPDVMGQQLEDQFKHGAAGDRSEYPTERGTMHGLGRRGSVVKLVADWTKTEYLGGQPDRNPMNKSKLWKKKKAANFGLLWPYVCGNYCASTTFSLPVPIRPLYPASTWLSCPSKCDPQRLSPQIHIDLFENTSLRTGFIAQEIVKPYLQEFTFNGPQNSDNAPSDS